VFVKNPEQALSRLDDKIAPVINGEERENSEQSISELKGSCFYGGIADE
jgi:hypothetical protein